MNIRRIITRTCALIALSAAALTSVPGAPPAAAIEGGVDQPAATFPYLASIGPLRFHGRCDGTLIAARTVLTAASCANDAVLGTVGVQLGAHRYEVVSIVKHPLWRGAASGGHDLALMTLKTAPPVAPVQVGAPWDPGATRPETSAAIVGRHAPWGEPSSTTVSVATGPLRSDEEMAVIFDGLASGDYGTPVWWHAEHMIGVGTTTATICNDVGVPAIVDRNGTPVQVGVASFNKNWPEPDLCRQPGGFTELTGAQLAWVASKVSSVKAAWGPCTTPAGNAGRSSAMHMTTPFTGAKPDQTGYPNSYTMWWDIVCIELADPPADPGPPPPSEPEPADPLPCRGPIRKCDDLERPESIP